MAGRNTAVFGIYSARNMVEDGVAHLKSAGFRNTDLSVMFPENEGSRDLAFTKRTKTPEGAMLGAILGLIAGGLLGWAAGAGVIAIPGTEVVTGAGPIASMLAGIAILGVLGGVVGALAGAGMPEYEAKRYDGRVRRGGILLSVHCDNSDWVKQARKILRDTGALHISSAGEAKGDFGGARKPESVRTAGKSGGPPAV